MIWDIGLNGYQTSHEIKAKIDFNEHMQFLNYIPYLELFQDDLRFLLISSMDVSCFKNQNRKHLTILYSTDLQKDFMFR